MASTRSWPWCRTALEGQQRRPGDERRLARDARRQHAGAGDAARLGDGRGLARRRPDGPDRGRCWCSRLLSLVPAIGALVFGVWLRRELERAGGPAGADRLIGQRRSCRSADRAASIPLMPWTPPPGRRRRRTQVEPVADAIRIERRPRPEDELADVLDPAVDVAADVVRVVRLAIAAGPCVDRARIRSRNPGANRSTCASIRSVMSTSDPAGTWQYAHAVVLPAGARDVSHGAYWTNRTYGRSGCRPAATSASDGGDLVERAAEVDRRRAARPVRRPRDRPVERPVDLEDARAVAEPLAPGAGTRRTAGRRRWPTSWRGVTSNRTARAAGSSASDVDPVAGDDLAAGRLAAPRPARRDGGRAAADHRPADGVGVGREDEPERGTQRAIEVEHRVGRDPGEQRTRGLVAERGRGPARAPSAAPAARTGRAPAGAAGGGRPAGGAPAPSLSASRTSGPNSRRQARPSAAPRPAAVAATDRSSTTARPPSSGCATGASGWIELDARAPPGRSSGRTARRAPAAGSSSTRRGGTRGASAPSVRVPPPTSGRPRRPGPSARHGPG